VVLQFEPNGYMARSIDTTGFSRVVFQFLPKQVRR
jgi:hypothetical protein